MSRFQWYELEPFGPKQLSRLSKALLQLPFSATSRLGYKIDQVRPETMSGIFVEKISFTEVLEDPFGNRTEIERVRYDTIKFQLSSTFPHLECIDAGRTLKSFKNELSRALDFEVSITKITLNLQPFVRILAANTRQLVLSRVIADDIYLGDGAMGQLHVSGERDVREQLKKFLSKVNFNYARVRIDAAFGEESFALEASQAGGVSTLIAPSEKVLRMLRGAVRECAGKPSSPK